MDNAAILECPHAQLARNSVPVPENMRDLPRDEKRGYLIPAFVDWVKGEPEFRLMNQQHFLMCLQHKLCWTCGKPLRGANHPFVVGPMCTVNRISSEPPSHVECARYSALVCPFLTMPKMERRESGDLVKHDPPGLMLKRNPGMVALWFAQDYLAFNHGSGLLFSMGKPAGVEWYTHGRKATREEVSAAYDAGLPTIREAAAKDGPEELKSIEKKIISAQRWFPKR